jgi:hypothetical protein
MGSYAKTAPGERLVYQPENLSKYEGEPFCLRITPEDIELERCFFVYLDEKLEAYSIRWLFQTYFTSPRPDNLDEMESWMEPWLRIDPMLPKKYALLRQMIAKVHAHGGKVLTHINHGPGPVNTEDTIHNHLGTSTFADGSFDDKILDLVLDFHAGDLPMPELDQWAQFSRTDTSGVTGPTARVKRRRFTSCLVLSLLALVGFPFLLFSCRGNNNGGVGGRGAGFGGGML